MNDGPPTGDQQDTNGTAWHNDGPQAVTVADAARLLGLSVDAIRGRLQRGTLPGEKVEGIWQVYLTVDDMLNKSGDPRQQATTGHQQATIGDQQATTGEATGVDGPRQATDIAPLVALVEDLTAQVRDLSATAAMWQTRAAHLDDQLKQLNATVSVPDDSHIETYRAPSAVAESRQSDDRGPQQGLRAWLHRLLGG
jgi:hypothetical protein